MRTQATKVIDIVLLVIVVGAAYWGTVALIDKIYDRPVLPEVHTPAFKAGDCFVRNGIRESWDKEADGKVIFRGISRYILMDAAEAERRSGGNKVGFEQTIEVFDLSHHKVLCPLNWQPGWKSKGITK